MRTFALAAAGLLFLLDFQNLLAYWHGRTLRPAEEAEEDFTVVVPLFGHPRYFTARESLEPMKRSVLVVCEVTPTAMAAYADELEAAGFGVLRVSEQAPSSVSLIRRGFHAIATTYALRLDADTVIDERVGCAVKAFADSGADIASFRIEALDPRSVAGRMQALEYRISMLSRRYRPWLTSGACFIGRTAALRKVYEHHSMWTPGEDIETGRAALALGMRIRHVDYVAYTEVPAGLRSLFRQRVLWWAGNYRHMVVNFDHNILQLPALTAYYVLGVWVSVYFHVWSALTPMNAVHYLPVMLVLCTLVTALANLQVLSAWMLLFPVYAMVQTFILAPLGMVKYARLAYARRDLGRYRFGWLPARG